MFLVMFLMIGALFIISEKNVNIKTSDGIKHFVSYYFSWMGHTFKNIGTATGYVVKLDWLKVS